MWSPVSNSVEDYFKCNCFMITHARCGVCIQRVCNKLLLLLVMMEGFEVSMRSRMLPDSMRVGSFTIFCNPNSPIISSNLLCLLAVLVFDVFGYSNQCRVG